MNTLEKWLLEKLRKNFQTKKIAVLGCKEFWENDLFLAECHPRSEGINFQNTTTVNVVR